MERLTFKGTKFLVPMAASRIELCEEIKSHQKYYDRLSEYENTGLTPQEVEKLKRENAELKARLEKSVELPCKVGDMVYYYSVFMSGMLQAKASEVIFDKWGYKINVDGRVFTNRELNIKFFFDKGKAKQALIE